VHVRVFLNFFPFVHRYHLINVLKSHDKFETVHVDEGSEADLREIKQQLESTIGADELQQKLTRVRSRISESLSESGSVTDRKSLNGSLKRYNFKYDIFFL